MASTKNPSEIFESAFETQAKLVNDIVENTKKITKDFPVIQETIDKGHKMYTESIAAQKELVQKASSNMAKTTEEMKQQSDSTQNFFQNWLENQMNWAKTSFNPTQTFSAEPKDWQANYQNWMNQAQQQWAQMNGQNPFTQMMGQNPFMNMGSFQTNMNDNLNAWSQQTKKYFETMNSSYSDFAKHFSNMTSSDSFKGMKDLNQNLSSFFELWMPMFKSMQEQSFNANVFSQLLSPEKFKSFIDGFFKFMPDDTQKMFEQINAQFAQNMKQVTTAGLNNYESFKNQLGKMQDMHTNPFAQMMSMYNNWKQAFDTAASPLTTLMNENDSVKNAMIWNSISDKFMQFSVKNNELQYMIYQNGLKAMDTLATKVTKKLSEGEKIESIVNLYQEWLVVGDEVFTTLFQSDEYSKLMTEVSSLQMKIKQEVDEQIEKNMLVNLPVATRTEMDEVYKSMYDLRKMYKNLEKMFEKFSTTSVTENESVKKPVAKKK